MKSKITHIFLAIVISYPPLSFAYTIDEPHYEGGLKYTRVNCENGIWDYIWFDGDTFYIEGLKGEREKFKTQSDAAEFVCRKEK